MSAAKANALLPVENGTRRSNSRNQHQQKDQRQPERERKQNADKIENRFPARHLWLGLDWLSDPNVNNFRRRAHGKAAALGHPPDIGKVSCHRCFVKLLQNALTAANSQASQRARIWLLPLPRNVLILEPFTVQEVKRDCKTGEWDQIQAYCFLSPPKRGQCRKDALSGSPLEYPAHLLLRKLEAKGPIFLCARNVAASKSGRVADDRLVCSVECAPMPYALGSTWGTSSFRKRALIVRDVCTD